MSKKKSKGQADNANWDEGLVNEKLSDVSDALWYHWYVSFDSLSSNMQEGWHAFVAFLVPSMAASESLLQSLSNAVKAGSRRKFVLIEKESMLASVIS